MTFPFSDYALCLLDTRSVLHVLVGGVLGGGGAGLGLHSSILRKFKCIVTLKLLFKTKSGLQHTFLLDPFVFAACVRSVPEVPQILQTIFCVMSLLKTGADSYKFSLSLSIYIYIYMILSSVNLPLPQI